MHAGCECNVVIATCPQRDLESTFLRCDNVAFTTLPQPKHNVVTTLSQRVFVCWGNMKHISMTSEKVGKSISETLYLSLNNIIVVNIIVISCSYFTDNLMNSKVGP